MSTPTEVNMSSTQSVLSDYFALIKFRLLSLVLVSACMGFYIGADTSGSLFSLAFSLIGILLVGGGANTLNQWKERHADALMYRTRSRPLPTRRLGERSALIFGILISATGFLVLSLGVNRLTTILSLISWATYLFLYTPMKTRTVINTWVGAVPGAIPAVLGFTAATNSLSLSALALFLILYVWQMPHFFAISWVYREDYVRGGFKMLSWNDETGTRTATNILVHTLLLVPVSTGLYINGDYGLPYLLITILNGLVFLLVALRYWHSPTKQLARHVFLYSILYLPLLFLAIIIDKVS